MVRVQVRKERVVTAVDVRLVLWVLTYVLLSVGGSAALPGYAAVDYHAYPKYSFKYGVSDAYTGDVKQHSEHREGDVVKGQYSLVEPDGSVRQVEYTADPVNGFNAVVLKSQPNVHPTAVKPVAVAAPAVAVQKPIAVAVAAAPLKYYPSAPVHYGHEQISAVPLGGHPYPYPYQSVHDPYSAYLHPRHYDYEQY